MPDKLTKAQEKVYRWVALYVERNGFGPSVREVGRGNSSSSSNAGHCMLDMLERKGWIRRTKGKARAIVPLVPLGPDDAQTSATDRVLAAFPSGSGVYELHSSGPDVEAMLEDDRFGVLKRLVPGSPGLPEHPRGLWVWEGVVAGGAFEGAWRAPSTREWAAIRAGDVRLWPRHSK